MFCALEANILEWILYTVFKCWRAAARGRFHETRKWQKKVLGDVGKLANELWVTFQGAFLPME